MKIKNRIQEKDKQSQIIEILNHNWNLALVGVDPWIDWVLSLPLSSPVEEQWNLCKKMEEWN